MNYPSDQVYKSLSCDGLSCIKILDEHVRKWYNIDSILILVLMFLLFITIFISITDILVSRNYWQIPIIILIVVSFVILLYMMSATSDMIFGSNGFNKILGLPNMIGQSKS